MFPMMNSSKPLDLRHIIILWMYRYGNCLRVFDNLIPQLSLLREPPNMIHHMTGPPSSQAPREEYSVSSHQTNADATSTSSTSTSTSRVLQRLKNEQWSHWKGEKSQLPSRAAMYFVSDSFLLLNFSDSSLSGLLTGKFRSPSSR